MSLLRNAEDLHAADAREQLRRWDAGESVWSLELGGIGPGYEQCIQVMAIEIVRDQLDRPQPEQPESNWGDETIERVKLGPSGAQVGQAKWLAWKWLTIGPAELVAKAKVQGRGDDLILVSNVWPRVGGEANDEPKPQ